MGVILGYNFFVLKKNLNLIICIEVVYMILQLQVYFIYFANNVMNNFIY